jgi:hypothetical protein
LDNSNRSTATVLSSSSSLSDIATHHGFVLPHQIIPGFSIFDDLAPIAGLYSEFNFMIFFTFAKSSGLITKNKNIQEFLFFRRIRKSAKSD